MILSRSVLLVISRECSSRALALIGTGNKNSSSSAVYSPGSGNLVIPPTGPILNSGASILMSSSTHKAPCSRAAVHNFNQFNSLGSSRASTGSMRTEEAVFRRRCFHHCTEISVGQPVLICTCVVASLSTSDLRKPKRYPSVKMIRQAFLYSVGNLRQATV